MPQQDVVLQQRSSLKRKDGSIWQQQCNSTCLLPSLTHVKYVCHKNRPGEKQHCCPDNGLKVDTVKGKLERKC